MGALNVTCGGAWVRVLAPTAQTPWWSDEADGQPLSIRDLLLNAPPDQIAALRRAHGQAVAALIAAAFDAAAAREHQRARELFTRAGRLCTEPLGHCPREGASS